MPINRRHYLLGSSALVSSVLASVVAGGGGLARAQGLRKLKFAVGLKAMGPAVINTVIGEVLGYHKEEGFTLEVAPLGTNANVQIAIDKGDVDIGVGVPSFGLPLLSKGEWQGALNYYQYTYPYKWDVVVSPQSPIKTYQDLKGKRIGVSDFGGTEYPVTKRVLRSLGIDPETEVKWIPVGAGVQSGIALQREAIDALAFYDTGFGQIEAANIALRFLPRPDNLPMIGGQFLTAKPDFLSKDRKLAIGFARSVAKASVYLKANPEAGARAFLKMYPETAPRGASDAEAVKSILLASERRIKLYTPPYPGFKMGQINPQEFITEAEMSDLPRLSQFGNFYTNDLINEINAFDADQIIASAKSVKG